jgi:hypothetical protein
MIRKWKKEYQGKEESIFVSLKSVCRSQLLSLVVVSALSIKTDVFVQNNNKKYLLNKIIFYYL